MTDTIEANKKIHDWMGNKRMEPPFQDEWIGQQKAEDLKYHTSWDWLMPAAKKFVELPYMVGLPGFKTLVINHIAAFDIEEAHRYLVKGIDFYTTTKTENK